MFCTRSALRTGTTEDRPFCKLRYDTTEDSCLQGFFTNFFLNFRIFPDQRRRSGTSRQQPKTSSCSDHQKKEKNGQNQSRNRPDPPQNGLPPVGSQSPGQYQPQGPPSIQKRQGQKIEAALNDVGPGKDLLSYPDHGNSEKEVCKGSRQNRQQFPSIRKP